MAFYAYVKDTNRFVDIFGLLQGTLLAIQSKINTILEAHLPQILKIDPNATIGYRGSSASGISKIHSPKLSKPINLNSFDVDAFIKSDYLANFFDNRMRYANEISGILEIEQSIQQQQLKQAFSNNDFKGEPFGFRIFKSYELDEFARKGDIQIHIKYRN